MIRHPLDPLATYTAAERFVPLIVQELLTVAECVPVLIKHAADRGYSGDASGLQARLTWALQDGVTHLQSRRERAESFIVKDAREAMDRLEKSPAIMRAANKTNTHLGSPLTTSEVRSIVTDTAKRWLKQWKWRHG